jgi:four helix bundle protein
MKLLRESEMRNSKSQAPSSKEGPSSKLQGHGAAGPVSAWNDDALQEGTPVLRDAPSQNSDGRPPFDLEERTALFGENIVKFSKRIPRDPTNNRLIDQLVGCATSVGANYCEANEGVSKKDFRNSIARCKKEVKETKLFLRLIAASEPSLADQARVLYREATELQRILATMYRK